ncbi:MAG: hypothetical protein ACMXX6_01205 [Candidatus Woesearchaeota archaeon]
MRLPFVLNVEGINNIYFIERLEKKLKEFSIDVLSAKNPGSLYIDELYFDIESFEMRNYFKEVEFLRELNDESKNISLIEALHDAQTSSIKHFNKLKQEMNPDIIISDGTLERTYALIYSLGIGKEIINKNRKYMQIANSKNDIIDASIFVEKDSSDDLSLPFNRLEGLNIYGKKIVEDNYFDFLKQNKDIIFSTFQPFYKQNVLSFRKGEVFRDSSDSYKAFDDLVEKILCKAIKQ